MKNKGFTLIELLAVIVVLAIVFLIAAPVTFNMIKNAKENAAKSNAFGYLDALEKDLVEDEVEDGEYYIGELNVSSKGQKPSKGIVYVEDAKVKTAKLCVNNYSIDYIDSKISFATSNYCGDNNK